jgi:hypothetical protein
MSAWIDQMFDAQIVEKDGLVRRNIADVNKFASFKELIERVKQEDYHLIETGEQCIVICNPGVLKIHC